MDKPASWWALLSAFGIFIVLGTSIPGALLSMYISGIIPGTNYTLPLWVLLTVYPAIAITAMLWIVSQTIFIGEINKPVKETLVIKTKTSRKKKVAIKQPALKQRPRAAV